MGARQELKGAETVRISSRARIRQGIRVGWFFYVGTSSVAGRAMTWGAVDGVEKMGILKTSWERGQRTEDRGQRAEGRAGYSLARSTLIFLSQDSNS